MNKKKEVFEQCLKEYKDFLNEIKKSDTTIKALKNKASQKNMHLGLCFYLQKNNFTNIEHLLFIVEIEIATNSNNSFINECYRKSTGYIYLIPAFSTNKNQLQKSIEARIFLVESIIKNL